MNPMISGDALLDQHHQALDETIAILKDALIKAALSLDDMETTNATLGRDLMAATCLVVSTNIRRALAKVQS